MPRMSPRICKCGLMVAAGYDCPRCAPAARRESDARRPTARARGYDSKWDLARRDFLQANPSCTRVRPNGAVCGSPATVVHHGVPHRGDKKLFWSRSNWFARCKPCHDVHDQSDEKSVTGFRAF
ncbi:HNH endonuclease [Tardiphaga sp. vice352]|nr:HNH endonuclease [Tardiphaga sp. vice278]QDM29973.1 HNH endonuclease [Tardiphaga sp. vice352]